MCVNARALRFCVFLPHTIQPEAGLGIPIDATQAVKASSTPPPPPPPADVVDAAKNANALSFIQASAAAAPTLRNCFAVSNVPSHLSHASFESRVIVIAGF